ncbi:hypothetical protein SBC1_78540 (plasmid) [Caballeronia sp. SBC1]|uniref:hypothetical protein n=1 Tax=Caballeronia sp. SBC1 TaxID=2705548 RepID=UPI00140E0D59|nr:hypothetical protein [Caballeronia sp. SBC1]QIN67807.1 hypothetical protein SBC1_78540 [Caballeronia sp. SBC1]
MTYSCTDFTDDVINRLIALGLIEKNAVSPEDTEQQATLAIRAIATLVSRQQLELLRAVVQAKLTLWDALKRLEDALTDGKGFSDRANDGLIEAIDSLATAAPAEAYDAITEEHLRAVSAIVEKYPDED